MNQLQTLTEHFFSDEHLKIIKSKTGINLKKRNAQVQMSKSIANAMKTKSILCVEAPTGIGKSLSYLIPVIYDAIYTKKKTVILTETINLQEQLINDISFLQKIIEPPVSIAIAKGRGNYLCKYKLQNLKSKRYDTLKDLNKKIITKSDINDDYILNRWDKVSTSSLECHICENNQSCCYMNAKKHWNESDVIISNYAMFFENLKFVIENPTQGFIFNYDNLIFDEAHSLEDQASNHLGIHISNLEITRFFNKIKEIKETIEGNTFEEMIDMSIDTLLNEYYMFIEDLNAIRINMLKENKDMQTQRINKMGIISTSLYVSLLKFHENLHKSMLPDNLKEYFPMLYEVSKDYSIKLNNIINMRLNNHVYFIQLDGENSISLNAIPLNIKTILQQHIFNENKSVILTSATLTINTSFDFYKNRLGLTYCKELLLETPFDFDKNVTVIIPRMPNVTFNTEETLDVFDNALIKAIKKYVEISEGNTLVLFTSFKRLNRMAKHLYEYFKEKNIELLVQKPISNKKEMLNTFCDIESQSVIFGTSSFWTGVDIKGEKLSNIMITQIPFNHKYDPITEGRCELLKDSFRGYILPRNIMKFKQGIGRLKRGEDDAGIIVILDNRILTKNYKDDFLKALPKCEIINHYESEKYR